MLNVGTFNIQCCGCRTAEQPSSAAQVLHARQLLSGGPQLRRRCWLQQTNYVALGCRFSRAPTNAALLHTHIVYASLQKSLALGAK